ncbi:MAG: tRNA glutamyl-Q(34) synthetase GluQRS, partial [Sedimenticola sp.]
GKKLSKQTQAHRVDKKKPLPELIAAFEFLGQQLDREKPGSVAEFWEFARENWQIDKIR